MIRPATEGDVEAITRLFFETVTNVNAKDYDETQIRAWSTSAQDQERWLSRINTQHFWVAEAGKELQGFASLTREGYLDVFFVGKDFQGQGVGKKLLTALEKMAGTSAIPRIESDVSITAKAFFEKHGYQVVREQKVIFREVEFTNYRVIKESKRQDNRL